MLVLDIKQILTLFFCYRIQCSLGIFQQADGSAYLEQGNTKVLAAVYGPHEVRF